MEDKKRKIGIMGGTFDPIHIGHLILGETAYEQLQLDKVFFMPAGNPPHKQNRRGRASDEQRVEMVSRAIASNPHFELSLVEMNEDGYTYTYRTLEQLNAAYPDVAFYFILGADSLFNFDTWMEPQRICDACTVVIATRNHTSSQELDKKIQELSQKYHGTFVKLESLNIDISSGTLREWIKNGKTIRYYVSDSVIDYIREEKMYKGCGMIE
ncbi:MAG: nicotinate-nucleotide adenylyltransferase [Lachnospiraceae bacterium]|jgi:nicotinate-nucleotide adenylyltransferase